MNIKKELIDDSFEKYSLSFTGKSSINSNLPLPIRLPLEVPSSASKELWNLRVFYNCLAKNPFQQHAVYYISQEGELIQVDITSDRIKSTKLVTFPTLMDLPPEKAHDNPSIRFIAGHLGVLADGTGQLHLFGYMQGHWSILWTTYPLGAPASISLIQAQLTTDEKLHCLIGNLTSKGNHVYAISIDLQSPDNVKTTLILKGGKSVRYAEFKAPNEVAFLVEDTHELCVSTQSAPHKRQHEPDAIPAFKAPRAGIGFTGEMLNPELPLPPISKEDLYSKPLHQHFLASSTPYSSFDQPLHTSAPNHPPALPQDTPLEIPTTDSMLGGYEECDDVDPNASAILYSYNFADNVCTASLRVDCRSYKFLGPSSLYGDRLLFQYDVHGLVYSVDWKPFHLSLVHENTFQAFGYVQAAKTQKKFTLFHPSSSLAVIADFEKRLFVYRGKPEVGQKPHTLTSYIQELSTDQVIYGVQFTNESTIVVLTSTNIIALTFEL